MYVTFFKRRLQKIFAPMPEIHTRWFDSVRDSLANEFNNNHVLTNFGI